MTAMQGLTPDCLSSAFIHVYLRRTPFALGMFRANEAASQQQERDMARYGKKAAEKVEKVMKERKEGTLRSGRSGKKVTSRKQAIAIGLSEARRAGGKVPPPPRGRRRTRAKKK